MKITFFSNFFNSHQLPLALEFNAMDDVEYTFVSLLRTDGAVGRSSLDLAYSFVLREYDGPEEASKAMDHALGDDVVIFGDMAGKEQYVRARAKTGKIFFRYAERLLKRGDWWRYVPPKRYRTWNRFGRYTNSNMYVLCASAYTARDLSMFGFPKIKCLKWGYFPSTTAEDKPIYTPNERFEHPRDMMLFSAQRLLPWKRVDLQIQAVHRLKQEGIDVFLRIAGDGPERQRLEHLAASLNVVESIEFLGELAHSEVLALMNESGIFLATSDRNEGWGATINEAMAMGSCVIASEEMGSVPFLIENKSTGLVFNNELSELVSQIKIAVENPELATKYGQNAKNELENNWSARVASERLYNFVCFADSPVDAYVKGPLSAN